MNAFKLDTGLASPNLISLEKAAPNESGNGGTIGVLTDFFRRLKNEDGFFCRT